MSGGAPRVSVIVPVYNAGALLAGCADSLRAQTVSDWECLLVDDGSTDGSAALCDALAGADSRFRAFHKPNGGVSSARNLGLDQARGEYITFLDQDDRLSSFALEFMLEAQSARPGAYVSCLSTEYPHGLLARREPVKLASFSCAQVGRLFHHCPAFNGPWCKLFRAELLRRFSLRFSEDVKDGYEDRPFVYAYLRRFWQAFPDQPVILICQWLYLWEQGNPASVSKRNDRVLRLRHLTMFDGLFTDALTVYEAPATEMSDYAREYLHTLLYGASLLPPGRLRRVMGQVRASAEFGRLMDFFAHNRIYSPYYLPLRLHLDRLACAICRSGLSGRRLYRLAYSLGLRLLGRGWVATCPYPPPAVCEL